MTFSTNKTIPLEKKGHGHSRVKIWCFIAVSVTQVDVLQYAETMQHTHRTVTSRWCLVCYAFHYDALIAFHLLQINTLWCLFVKRLSCSLVLFPVQPDVDVLWCPILFLTWVSSMLLNYAASIYPVQLQTSRQQLKANKKRAMWDSGTMYWR